jgi:ADP-ribosylglycohydrolase
LFRIHKEYIDAYGPHRFGGVRDRFATFTPDKPLSHLAYPSWGNGVMMKQFPYAAYFVAANKPLDEQDTIMESITAVTHNSPIAKYVSLVHNRMLVTLFTSQPDTFDM